MSLEAVTIGVARVVATVDGIKGVYALAGSPAHGILPFRDDIPDAPVAVVTHDRFELEPGSFEKIRHFVNVELYLRATEVDSAEVEAGRLAYAVIAAFRTHVTLFDTLTTPGMTGWAAVRGGGPPAPEDVNGQPFSVYPMIVQAVEAGPAIYTGG